VLPCWQIEPLENPVRERGADSPHLADDEPMRRLSPSWPKGAIRMCKNTILACESLYRLAVGNVRRDFERGGEPVAKVTIELERERERYKLEKDINDIMRDRFQRTAPHHRAHYSPDARFKIIQLQNAQGWSDIDTAERFVVSADTIGNWRRTNDDDLVSPRVPVNKHSDRVAYLLHVIHSQAPAAGARKLAAMLAQAGVVLAPSTVRRVLKRTPKKPPPKPPQPEPTSTAETPPRIVKAKHAHHLWHVDFTQFRLGDCVPGVLAPLINLMMWPVCWHLAVVVDHWSRQLVHFRVFWRQPTGAQLARVLDVAVGIAGTGPKHIVTDRGPQFMSTDFGQWCIRNKTRPRHGAIGQHGSIAVVERFIRTLKREHLRRIFIPPTRIAITRAIATFQRYYNGHRPHSALGGLTPLQKANDTPHPSTTRRYELRPLWPIADADTDVVIRVDDIDIDVIAFEGQRHLPVLSAHASL